MIYADANIIIRLIEGDTAVRAPIEARLLPFKGSGPFLLTSRLTQLECRVMPLRIAWTGQSHGPELAALLKFMSAGTARRRLESHAQNS